MDVGVIGLGVMGENLILNIEEKGYKVSVYNRTTSKTNNLVERNAGKNISGHKDLKDFVNSLVSPRKIILLIKSGDAVDIMIDNLLPFISKEDVIIDAGNSFYEDTDKRYSKYQGKFLFLGVGISGGELGARHGPSIMVGGDKEGWINIKPIFEKISAKSDNKPCCAYFGNSSSGHFVKMVHNGIEYCEMQLIAEICFLYKKSKLTNQKISDIFGKWLNEKELQSYLLEITQIILKRKDNLIDNIMDKASQKGTGMQCVSTALNYSSVCTLMSDAVFSRIISSKKEMRQTISQSFQSVINEEICIDDKIVKSAFLMAKAIAYVQGYNFMLELAKAKHWDIKLQDASQIWKNGCILRGGFLDVMIKMSSRDCLETSDTFKEIYKNNFENLKLFVKQAIDKNVPIPCFASALNYINGIILEDGSGNLIQAMRDCFGSHTVQFKGENEFIHVDWLKKDD